jgi:hypothetical protein
VIDALHFPAKTQSIRDTLLDGWGGTICPFNDPGILILKVFQLNKYPGLSQMEFFGYLSDTQGG